MYRPFLEEMGTDRLAVAVDTPSYGVTEPPPGPTGLTDYAKTLATVLDRLDLDQVNLFGAHTGSR